jgi:magnesium-transporting ATPase (P-type)
MPDDTTTRPETTEDGAGSGPTRPARPPWHALEVPEVAEHLDVELDAGLAADDAARRLDEHGPNELATEEPRSNLDIVIAQFKSPLIYILLVAAVVTVLIDEYTDAAVIAAVLVINAVIGFIQERKADRSVNALMELASPTSRVLRDGRKVEIDARELVPGDLVLLQSGDRVPADLRVVTANQLAIDESLLTGESEPTTKRTEPVEAELLAADRTSIAHMGSAVSSGRGRGLVVATAGDTQLGRIAEQIRQEVKPDTPLQRRMHRFANIIAVAVLGSTLVAFFLGLALGEPVNEMFLTAVALAVAVVPEGLPVAFTVAMALGVHRMAQRNAIIRSLPAVETLGSTNTIGSDKTGTLTQNRMTVLRAWTASGFFAVGEQGRTLLDGGEDLEDAAEHADPGRHTPLSETVRTAVVTNESDVERRDPAELAADEESDDEFVHRGDPTETALLEAAYRVGFVPDDVRESHEVLVDVPFESERRYSMTVTDEHGPVLRLKGAPERVLELCTRQATADGEVELDRDAVLAAAHTMAEQGLRVLAMAMRRLDDGTVIDPESPPEPEELVLTGLMGMQDPPRPGVRDSVQACREAGIRVIMITGDHAATARAIARDLGIATGEDAEAITGTELEQLTDEELRELVLEVDVFARVAPDHKHRVVTALQYHDQVVAVTGDGVNDGPALKAADIGVAMGRDGTDVAREASDMVLTDDNFVSIANAVEEGRVVFDNVRKVTYFLLSTGVAAIVAIIYSIAAGIPLPYVPAALLWLNVVTNGLQDVALAFEKGEPDVLDQPPRRRDEGIVTPLLWERTVLLGITMAAGSLWLFLWAIDAGLNDAQQRGAALTTLVVAMAVHAGNARSERRSLFAVSPLDNKFLSAAVAIALAIHVAASYWGPTQTILQIEPVTAEGWYRIGVVVVVVIVVSELHKWVRSRRGIGPWTTPSTAAGSRGSGSRSGPRATAGAASGAPAGDSAPGPSATGTSG